MVITAALHARISLTKTGASANAFWSLELKWIHFYYYCARGAQCMLPFCRTSTFMLMIICSPVQYYESRLLDLQKKNLCHTITKQKP